MNFFGNLGGIIRKIPDGLINAIKTPAFWIAFAPTFALALWALAILIKGG